MVNKTEAQLFTMEGFAAGILMLVTIYLVLGTTTVYTSGDSHITDMQYEQIGTDILRVMDTPRNLTGSWAPCQSELEAAFSSGGNKDITGTFNRYLYYPALTARDTTITDQTISTSAYRTRASNPDSPAFLGGVSGSSQDVRVTHLVHTQKPDEISLVEVYLWRM